MADGLRAVVRADFGIEPAAGIQAARFAGQRHAPLAEALFEEGLVQARQVADLADAQRVEVLFGHLADARNLAHVERRQERRLAAGHHPQHAVGLGLIGGDLGHQARGRDADGAVQARRRLHALVQQVGGAQGRAVQAFGAGHIEVGLVDGGHLHQRREGLQHVVDLVRAFAVALGVAVDEDGMRAELVGGAQRHGGMDAELARRIGRRGDHAALVRTAAHHHGLAFQGRVEQLFHRHEEGVHVDVEVGAHWPSRNAGSFWSSRQPPGYVAGEKVLHLTMPWNGSGSARPGNLIPIMPAAVPYQQTTRLLRACG